MTLHILEVFVNAERSKLAYLSPTDDDGDEMCGYRIAGPKPWGGSSTLARLEIDDEDLVHYIKQYAPNVFQTLIETSDNGDTVGGKEKLTFEKLRKVNSDRAIAWNGDTPWSPRDRMNEFVGELGEAANIIKKLHRIECGMPGTDPSDRDRLMSDLCDEIGDVMICLDLLAWSLGIDIAEVTTRKFDKTSIKVGFPHRLGKDAE